MRKMDNEERLTKILDTQEARPWILGSRKALISAIILVMGLGIVTGYFLSQRSLGGKRLVGEGVVAPEKIKPGTEFGVRNTSTFKDTTIGILEKNGVDGEGTHKLIREGGPSQTAYLTSSVLDLDQFVGRKVQVWGETFQAQKAGWLMDVGRVKVLE